MKCKGKKLTVLFLSLAALWTLGLLGFTIRSSLSSIRDFNEMRTILARKTLGYKGNAQHPRTIAPAPVQPEPLPQFRGAGHLDALPKQGTFGCCISMSKLSNERGLLYAIQVSQMQTMFSTAVPMSLRKAPMRVLREYLKQQSKPSRVSCGLMRTMQASTTSLLQRISLKPSRYSRPLSPCAIRCTSKIQCVQVSMFYCRLP